MVNEGSRGTREILTRFPETVGLEDGERHEGIQIALIPIITHIKEDNRQGLNE